MHPQEQGAKLVISFKSAEVSLALVGFAGGPASRSSIPSVDGLMSGVRGEAKRECLAVERGESLV